MLVTGSRPARRTLWGLQSAEDASPGVRAVQWEAVPGGHRAEQRSKGLWVGSSSGKR